MKPTTPHYAAREARTCNGVLEAIGGTPVVQLRRFLDDETIDLRVKLESFNPGGSAKDRPARRMIEDALAAGEIHPGSTVIESSSGNMGIGLAQACRYYGLKFICVVDPRAQPQNIAIMRALGAQIEQVTKPIDGDFLAARLARVCWLLEHTRDSYWSNQYANDSNPTAHAEETARELDDAFGGDLDWLFVAISSTGTMLGCQRYFQDHRRPPQIVAVDAHGSVLFGGEAGKRLMPGLGAGRVPPLSRNARPAQVVRVSDADCVVGCRRLAATEAILAGGSGGGVLQAVRTMRDQLTGARCAAILHDSGVRYLDTVYNDQWVQQHLHIAPTALSELAGLSESAGATA
ncbi:2,3-diaminopropionate biosynthesis protein SbnA [Posidoniimonas polymericola]|nr:2,3-diaminopropionate biosynthesis protein SbnA [Posidoniimonas polymericola]